MKRYNFLKYQPPEEGTAPAVSRTTTTKPVDYVGELRVTRFKLSRGTLPIGFIEPSKRGFTSEQIATLTPNRIPTDIEMFVYCDRNMKPNTVEPNNGEAYIISGNAVSGFFRQAPNSGSRKIDIDNTFWSVYSFVAIAGEPIWQKKSDGKFYLQNESVPFYSWSDFHNKSLWINNRAATATEINTPIYNVRLIESADGKPKFYIRMNAFNLVATTVTTMNPTICFNNYARQFFGMNISSMPSVNFDMPQLSPGVSTSWGGYNAGDNLTFYVPPMSYDWNSQMKLMIQNQYTNYGDTIFNMDCTYTPIVQTLPENYFPLSHIIITADELNFQGESICVDTTKKQGVIDPSNLTILKSFYIGLSDSFLVSTSDFIYINDSRDNDPVIVNSPRLVSLTIRVWLITKEGNLTPLMLNPGSSFSLQLSLQ